MKSKKGEYAKVALACVACAYGFIASAYLAAWHLCEFQRPFFCRFDFNSFSTSSAFIYFVAFHAVVLVLAFLERPETEFRWRPLIIGSENAIAVAKTLLGITLWYVAFLLLGKLISPPEWPGRNSNLIFTSVLFLQTLFVALFFLFGRERLFSPDFRLLFDFPKNLFFLGRNLRKLTRRLRNRPDNTV